MKCNRYSIAMQNLYCHSKMQQFKDGLIDHRCQSHLLFQALHLVYEQPTVGHVKKRDDSMMDMAIIIANYVEYFKELLVHNCL